MITKNTVLSRAHTFLKTQQTTTSLSPLHEQLYKLITLDRVEMGEPHAFPGSVYFTLLSLPDKTTLHLAAYIELATSCALYGFDNRK